MENSFNLRAEPEAAETLVEELAKQPGRNYPFRLENFAAGARIQESDPAVQSRAVLAMVRWLEQHGATTYNQTSWKMRQALFVLLKRRLPLSESDILIILDWSAQVGSNYWRGLPQLVKLVSDHLKQNELSTALAGSIGRLIKAVEAERMTVEDQRHILHLHELVGNQAVRLPMTEGDAWADAALADINALDSERRSAWARLLLCCLRATGSAPTRKWLKDSQASLGIIGEQDFRSAALQWFPLADRPRESPGRRDNGQMPLPGNADILKGLVWLCGRFEDAEIARALTALAISAYRRLPGYGPRAARIGNACFWALGSMPSAEGVAQLSILKVKIKGSSPQKAVTAAITMAAKRTGIAMEEMEELCVPTYGFEEVGTQSYMFNDGACSHNRDRERCGANVGTLRQADLHSARRCQRTLPGRNRGDHADRQGHPQIIARAARSNGSPLPFAPQMDAGSLAGALPRSSYGRYGSAPAHLEVQQRRPG